MVWGAALEEVSRTQRPRSVALPRPYDSTPSFGSDSHLYQILFQPQQTINRPNSFPPPNSHHLRMTTTPSPTSSSQRRSLFRPCIDLHGGVVKQIVGGTLSDVPDDEAKLKTNFVST